MNKRERNRRNVQEFRARNRAAGLCWCGRQPRPYRKTCAVCAGKTSASPKSKASRLPQAFARIGFGVTPERLAELAHYCEEWDMTLTVLIHEALDCYIENMIQARQLEAKEIAQRMAETVYEVFIEETRNQAS